MQLVQFKRPAAVFVDQTELRPRRFKAPHAPQRCVHLHELGKVNRAAPIVIVQNEKLIEPRFAPIRWQHMLDSFARNHVIISQANVTRHCCDCAKTMRDLIALMPRCAHLFDYTRFVDFEEERRRFLISDRQPVEDPALAPRTTQ